MTSSPANTPILVGVAQNEQRITDWQDHKEPLELMYDALQAAAVDCGNPKILDAATAVRVVRGRELPVERHDQQVDAAGRLPDPHYAR